MLGLPSPCPGNPRAGDPSSSTPRDPSSSTPPSQPDLIGAELLKFLISRVSVPPGILALVPAVKSCSERKSKALPFIPAPGLQPPIQSCECFPLLEVQKSQSFQNETSAQEVADPSASHRCPGWSWEKLILMISRPRMPLFQVLCSLPGTAGRCFPPGKVITRRK